MTNSLAAIAASVVFEHRASRAISAWGALGPTGWPGYGSSSADDVRGAFIRDLSIDRWSRIPRDVRARLEWAEKQDAASVAADG